jgi:hypothetical protein
MRIMHAKILKLAAQRDSSTFSKPVCLDFRRESTIFQAARKRDNTAILRAFLPDPIAFPTAPAARSDSYAERLIRPYPRHAFSD